MLLPIPTPALPFVASHSSPLPLPFPTPALSSAASPPLCHCPPSTPGRTRAGARSRSMLDWDNRGPPKNLRSGGAWPGCVLSRTCL
ncbi:hypothetical protein XELAEV_18044366mg [Xenopus laevis]|uniref:Uncharacterized protein n=1 Tax=Xenopus laevis TaxID=8355 RepID=A0A974BYE2_XENLA|nr:hypothetical protein XELAEV_18044366mg [Xenopus laevis]